MKKLTKIRWYFGEKYLFEVKSEPVGRRFTFVITAIDRHSGRQSHINNLNGVLGELGLDENDRRSEESSWVVSSKERERFHQIAEQMFRSRYMLKQIESTLDEDRMLGEWSNIRKGWNVAKGNHRA